MWMIRICNNVGGAGGFWITNGGGGRELARAGAGLVVWVGGGAFRAQFERGEEGKGAAVPREYPGTREGRWLITYRRGGGARRGGGGVCGDGARFQTCRRTQRKGGGRLSRSGKRGGRFSTSYLRQMPGSEMSCAEKEKEKRGKERAQPRCGLAGGKGGGELFPVNGTADGREELAYLLSCGLLEGERARCLRINQGRGGLAISLFVKGGKEKKGRGKGSL